MTDVGELFVRIRPDTTGFQAEAEGPVASAGKDLSKVFLAAFAVASVGDAIKGVITASTQHQAAFAVLSQTTKDAGASNELYGQSIESLLEKEARLKGFSDEDLASSFTRLVSATKDSQKAFTDLGLAEDVARARHIDLANAALAISKAEQGSATALQRLGIVVPAVTKNVDALKTSHENAIVAGAKFTDQQKQEYAQLLLTAQAQDKAATRAQDLAVIQQRFGGDATAFAQTAAGQFARLQADFHQFEVSIGTNLLPVLISAAEGAVTFVKALDNPEVLATIGTFAAIKVAIEGVSLAESAYQKIVAAGVATQAAETTAIGATTVQTTALAEEFAAVGPEATTSIAAIQLELTGLDEALTSTQLAIDGLGGAFASLPVEAAAGISATEAELVGLGETAAAVDAEISGFSAFGAGLLALATGPGAIVVGIAALAGGIAYLATRESATTEATHAFANSLTQLSGAIDSVPTDRLSVEQAKLTLAQDNTALSQSKLAHSSLDYQQLLLNLANDTLNLSNAEQKRKNDLAGLATSYDTARVKAEALAQAAKDAARPTGELPGRGGVGRTPGGLDSAREVQTSASTFARGINEVLASSKDLAPIIQHDLQLLEQFVLVYGKVPTEKQINLILDNRNATESLQQIVDKLEGLPQVSQAAAAQSAAAIDQQFGQAVTAGLVQFGPSISTAVQNWFTTIPGIEAAGEGIGAQFVAGVLAAAQTLQGQLQATIKSQLTAETNLYNQVNPLQQSLTADRASLAQLRTDASDAATAGAQALTQAIQEAKSNLDQIGQSIADTLGTYIDKPLQDAATRIQDAQAKLTALTDKQQLSQLGEEVILPGNRRLSSDPEKAVAQLEALQKSRGNDPALAQYILQFRSLALQSEADQNTIQQNAAGLVKTAAQTRLANLTELFNTGKISEKTLEGDVARLLEKNGLNTKTARARGASFADQLAGELTGLGQQAGAISATPGAIGTSGLIPSITRPLDTLNATQKQLASIASQERSKQLSETKTQTKILGDLRGYAKAQASLGNSSLDRNPGTKTRKTAALAGATG